MSNIIFRVAVVNMLLAGVYVALMTTHLESLSAAVLVLGCIALLSNLAFLLRINKAKNGESNETGPRSVSTSIDATPVSGKTRNASKAVKLPQYGDVRQSVPDDMPPWLRVKGNIVMPWEGKHHVAPVNGEDPFEVAQRLHVRLRGGGAVGGSIQSAESEEQKPGF